MTYHIPFYMCLLCNGVFLVLTPYMGVTSECFPNFINILGMSCFMFVKMLSNKSRWYVKLIWRLNF